MARKKDTEPEQQHDETKVLHGMAVKTLRGDIRDAVLTEFKHMAKPYAQMNESEQRRVIERAEDIARSVVNRAVLIAAAEGAPHLSAEIAQIVIKDGLKIQLGATGSRDNIVMLAEHHGPAVLVLVDPSKFKGQRAPAQPDVVGDLKMPRNGAGVDGEQLGEIIDVTPQPDGDGLDIPPGLRRLPPPGDYGGETPFRDFD